MWSVQYSGGALPSIIDLESEENNTVGVKYTIKESWEIWDGFPWGCWVPCQRYHNVVAFDLTKSIVGNTRRCARCWLV